MFWQLVRIEQIKLFRRRVLWVEIALLLSLVVAVLLIVSALYTSDEIPAGEKAEIEALVTGPLSLVSMLQVVSGGQTGGIALIVLAGAMVAQEYTWRTTSLWLRHGTPRPALLAAKLVTLMIAALIIGLAILFVNGTLITLFAHGAAGNLDPAGIDLVQLGLAPLRAVYTLLPYIALGLLLAVKSRSTIVTIGGGIAMVMGESIAGQILAQLGSKLPLYLPGLLSESLMRANALVAAGTVVSPAPHLLAPGSAALFIGLYTALLLALAAWAFRRQDVAA